MDTGTIRGIRAHLSEERSRRTFDAMCLATSVELVEALQWELLNEHELDPNEVSLAAMRRIDQLAGIDDEDSEDEATDPADERPRCTLIGVNGNAFVIIGTVARCLRRAGQHQRAKVWTRTATTCRSYHDMLALAFEFVDPE